MSLKIPEWVNDDSYRKTERDFKYYNSDLNKFIGEELPRIMTSIDIDLAQQKIDRKIIRIAEYKHENESMGEKQEILLQTLAEISKHLNATNYPIKLEVCVIRGNHPFEEIEVTDYVTNITSTYFGEDVKKYLTIEL